MFTPEQIIILHEISKQVLESLKYNNEKCCFDSCQPLSIILELSHYQQLREIEEQLSCILENLNEIAPKNI